MLKDFITQDEYKRTTRLLGNIRRDFGIDKYLLMRKMLIVVVITEYYQRKYKMKDWISYDSFLSRNEQFARDWKNVTKNPDFSAKNYLGGSHHTFFGIDSGIIIKGTPIDVIDTTHEYWKRRLGKNHIDDTPF